MTRPTTPPTLPPGTEVGAYVIEERIGVGGFGEVFRAKHPVIGRTVAIKVLHARYSHDAEAVARFVDEARTVNRISHPGIIEIYDFGRFDGREYFVMELVDGRSLRELLAERGKLPLAEALPILRGVAAAVDAAHAQGIAHRDLKPDNIFVTPTGTKLIDFGLAKLTRETDAVTETGSVFGTPLYMSPEQCRGRGVDTRTDVYSFGVVAYHVLTGEPLFGGDPIELALHHLNDPPEAPSRRNPALSKATDRVVLAMLAKDPAERPASLGAAVAALEGSAALRRRLSRRAKRAVLALVPVAALASGGVWLASRNGGTESCESKLDWTASRSALASKFAAAPEALARAFAQLDDAAARLEKQWDGACHADRSDALLYGQRIACLENAVLDFHDDVATLESLDLPHFEQAQAEDLGTGGGGRELGDCENTQVLRAQVPPPPAGVRDEVIAKRALVMQAMQEGWIALAHRDLAGVDRTASRVDALAREIERLHAASATFAILARIELLAAAAWDKDVRRLAAIGDARRDAARRLEAARDDIGLAQAQLAIASDAVEDARETTSLDGAAAAIERAAATIERAGRPLRAVRALDIVRGEFAEKRGRYDEAVDHYRAAGALTDPPPAGVLTATVIALARAERLPEALAAAQGHLKAVSDRYGATHPSTASPHIYLSIVYQLMGDLEAALAHQRAAHAAFDRGANSNPQRKPWGRVYMLDHELRLHRVSDADAVAAIRAIANLGTTPPLQNPDGVATVRRAGLYADYELGAQRTDTTGELEHADHVATLAFHRGDLAEAKRLAGTVATRCAAESCAAWMPFARWLAVLDDAALDDKLRALEAEYGGHPYAVAYSGIALAALGRWDAARAKLEAARDVEHVWEYQADLADLATWLGLARLHANDTAGARLSLEEALTVISIAYDGFDGFSYTTPLAELALADLVWTGTEPRRAKALAKRARDGFARLHRDADRERAVAWLAAHP